MNHQRTLFFCIAACAVFSAGVPAWSESVIHHANAPRNWSEGLQSLQDLPSSAQQLAESNGEAIARNHMLKKTVQGLQEKLGVLTKEQESLERTLADYDGKEKQKKGVKDSAAAQFDERQSQLKALEKEIALKISQLELLQTQEAQIFDRLKNAKSNALAEPPKTPTKEQLNERLEEGRLQLGRLQEKLTEQELLQADPKLSVPQLTVQRDELKVKRDELVSARNVPPKPIGSLAERESIKNLFSEIKDLSKRRSEYSGLLQAIEAQYNSGFSDQRKSHDEQKIQTSLVQLEKDNKLLQQKVLDLRSEMIEWDKQKVKLESVVNATR